MFKEKFKYYKSRCPPPTMENVKNFSLIPKDSCERRLPRKSCAVKNTVIQQHLIDVDEWEVFELKDNPGLIFIANPFTSQGQQFWVEKCLKDYTKKPNKLNLDPFDDVQSGENWWDKANEGGDDGKLLKKLRWATLGYHHNWDTKVYSDSDRSEFPSELAELSEVIVATVADQRPGDYRAEAAIVNFYHFDSTLSGHKDQSEPNMDSPLLSISFGQTAVFLIGGESLDDPVTAIFLQSGDVVVMSGQSRKSYHGVPRILPATVKPWADGSWENTSCGKYLETSRINLNIRQVLFPGQEKINR